MVPTHSPAGTGRRASPDGEGLRSDQRVLGSKPSGPPRAMTLESVDDLWPVLAAPGSGPSQTGMSQDELCETTEADLEAALSAPGVHIYTCMVATGGTPEHILAIRGHSGRCFVSTDAVRGEPEASSEPRGILT